jgi:hypothetical protein
MAYEQQLQGMMSQFKDPAQMVEGAQQIAGNQIKLQDMQRGAEAAQLEAKDQQTMAESMKNFDISTDEGYHGYIQDISSKVQPKNLLNAQKDFLQNKEL